MKNKEVVKINLNDFVSEIRRIWLYSGIFMSALSFFTFSQINDNFTFIPIIFMFIIGIAGMLSSHYFERQVIIKYFLSKSQETDNDTYR